MSLANCRMILFKTTCIIISILLSFLTFEVYTRKIVNNNQLIYGRTAKRNISKDAIFENLAVIIEFRSVPIFVVVVLNIIQNIPVHWPIQIFHCPSNKQFIHKSQLAKYIENGRIILTELPQYSGDFGQYTNTVLTSISFWEQVQGEKVLFFQIDSIMCSNSFHKITDYLQYDYIGAPWDAFESRVGNGGFSLRSRNKTITLLQQTSQSSSKYKGDINEDIWYSIHMSRVGTVAPLHVAKTFSVETMFYQNPLAVHKPTIKGVELAKLCKACPEARLIPPYCK